jgi:hypothetical protein
MNIRHILALAAGLCVASVVLSVRDASAAADRTLTGELVVTDASAHRFRIVGQSGSFTAPAGTAVEALDGHTVQVEVSSHGTVTQITEVHVPIQPVTHGRSTARGQLVVSDAGARRFTFVGDGQTYVAPPATDVAAYAGKMVEITLDENGQVTDFHLLPSP